MFILCNLHFQWKWAEIMACLAIDAAHPVPQQVFLVHCAPFLFTLLVVVLEMHSVPLRKRKCTLSLHQSQCQLQLCPSTHWLWVLRERCFRAAPAAEAEQHPGCVYC